MTSPPRRHNPPTYDEDQAADPYVYDEGDVPAYDDPNYVTDDPNPELADEDRQETDEGLARMHQREYDAEVAAEAQGAGENEDEDEDEDAWEENPDPEQTRREMVERERGFYEQEGVGDSLVADDDDED